MPSIRSARELCWWLAIMRAASGECVIWLLTMYPKNVAENILAVVLRRIRQEVDDG